jgi:hypothetical protein
MTVKQKFDRIDQSKLAQAQVDILKMMADKTDNFKTKDKATLDKIDASLDKIISALQEKNPDALKSIAKKTSTAKTATKGSKGGKTAMQLAKDIRKPNESWNEAVKRAGAIMRGDAKQASKVVTSELQKLKDFVNRRKQLKGIAGTDLLRDSKREAKPKGQRKSKEGNVYYEYRENRTDRLAPNYPKNAPLLAGGGAVNDAPFSVEVFKTKLRFDNQLTSSSKGDFPTYAKAKEFAIDMIDNGNYYAYIINKSGNLWGVSSNGIESFAKGGELVYASMEYDLAGNTSGGTAGLNADLPLSDVSGTVYTDLVGETGAMSAGEMFAGGGRTDHKYLNHSEDYEVRYAKGKNRRGYGNLKFELGGATMANQEIIADASQQYVNYYLGEGANRGMFKNGGAIKNQYAGRTPEDIWNSLTSVQKKHFLIDHFIKVEDEEQVEYSDLDEEQKEFVDQYSKSNWKNLDWVKIPFKKHVKLGQYATGGMMPMVSTRKHRND